MALITLFAFRSHCSLHIDLMLTAQSLLVTPIPLPFKHGLSSLKLLQQQQCHLWKMLLLKLKLNFLAKKKVEVVAEDPKEDGSTKPIHKRTETSKLSQTVKHG